MQLLLDDDGQSAYDHLSCDDRTKANKRFWWLTTPLFSDSTPDRRSEDFTRKLLIQLHSALPWDERFDWRDRFGGEALSEMLMRYGWPAYSAYGGAQEEASHAGWMGFYDSTRTATAEYPMDRLHLVPAWKAFDDPFHARADAWQINMPALTGDEEPAKQWWPTEHYARGAGGIVQLSDQTVMLRRDSDILLATASGLRSAGKELHVDTACRRAHPHDEPERHRAPEAPDISRTPMPSWSRRTFRRNRPSSEPSSPRRTESCRPEHGSASFLPRRSRRFAPARRRSPIPS